ncbi:MAG: response regulator [Syntrophobacter sp.]
MDALSAIRNFRLVLVDDDDSIRAALNYHFRKKKVAMISFGSGEEALDHLRQFHADIVITDYYLPGINGMQFIRELNNIRPGVIKILMTAYGTLDIAVEAIRAGVHDFIRKPFNTETLELTILSVMRRVRPDFNRVSPDGGGGGKLNGVIRSNN